MITTISTLPSVPNRNDPTTFSDKADALLGAMPTLVTELNNFVSEVNTLSFKTACRAATTTNITLSGTQTIDGVNISSGDRVLVKNQNNQAENGIYTASASTWTRAADMDTAAEVAGSFVPITFGATQGGKIYYTTFNATGGVLGTTAIPWNSLTDATITGVGTLAVANGGTGISSYSVGDLVYASAATTLTKLTAAASGNVLKSGTAPSWGKVALASDVSGTLPVANGGTGITATTGAVGNTFLASNGTGGWIEATLPGSSTGSSGIVQLATDAEVTAGTASNRAITPSTFRNNALVRSTAQTANGTQTSLAFTGIPSWVKRITIIMQGLSSTTTTGIFLQIGTNAGGYTSTGYESHSAGINAGTGQYTNTTSFIMIPNGATAANTITGHAILTAQQTGLWVLSGVLLYTQGAGAMQMFAGSISTGINLLDKVALFVPTGFFDAGSANIIYE